MTTDTDHTAALAELDLLWDKADALEVELRELKATIREKSIALSPWKVGDEAMERGKKVRIARISTRGYRTRTGLPAFGYEVNRVKKDGTFGKGVFHVYSGLTPVTPE